MDENNSIPMNETEMDNFPSDRWPGVIMILFSTPCIICYGFCLTAVLKNKDTRKIASYQIILHIGIADMMQLILNGLISGLFSICQSTGPFVLNKINGGLCNSAWEGYMIMANLLAWNRCVQIHRPHLARRVFDMRNTKIMLASSWIYAGCWMIAYSCPNLHFLYTPSLHGYDYHLSNQSQRMAYFEIIHDSLSAISMSITYTAIFAKILRQSNSISNKDLNWDKKEKQVLLQSAWICATTTLAIVWFFGFTRLVTSQWISFISNMFWLICAGSNSFIYLVFNKTIRRQVLRYIGRGKNLASNTAEGLTVTPAIVIKVKPTDR